MLQPDPDMPTAAVAALLRPGRRGIGQELLLIRRAEREGDLWSGHIALPGGRTDAIDASHAETARRETREEVAIDLGDAVPVIELPVVLPNSPRVPRIMIHPFVWHVDRATEPTPNEEVAAAHWVTLDALRDPSARTEYRLLHPEAPPEGIAFPGLTVGENILWGLTHRIVLSLLDVV